MSAFKHHCYLSDGVVLSQEQYEELYRTGKVILDDGRLITGDIRRDFLYSQDILKSLVEKH